ncbi:alpha/beta hydrolase [Pollutibacter soli]|uniref:alpha/beta hydrolase n=1 Tax=Pollutibacter soli TaxID=3034157 RepID=UPI0030138054
MHIPKLTVIVILLLSGIPKVADADVTHYYIHIKHDAVEIGCYDSLRLKPVPFKSYRWDDVNKDEIAAYLIGEDSQAVLFYLHCWLGSVGFYNKDVLKKLENLDGIDKTVSIVWESSGLSYHKSWEKARQQGHQLSRLFEYMLRFNEDSKNVLLCHSMGHSVFLGLLDGFQEGRNYFKLILFAGADLPSDIFQNDLQNLNTAADSIVIYTHQRDYILLISSILNHQKRLGMLSSVEQNELSAFPNVEIADVTKWPGNKALSPSNHIYFKEHEGVRYDMMRRIKEAIK